MKLARTFWSRPVAPFSEGEKRAGNSIHQYRCRTSALRGYRSSCKTKHRHRTIQAFIAEAHRVLRAAGNIGRSRTRSVTEFPQARKLSATGRIDRTTERVASSVGASMSKRRPKAQSKLSRVLERTRPSRALRRFSTISLSFSLSISLLSPSFSLLSPSSSLSLPPSRSHSHTHTYPNYTLLVATREVSGHRFTSETMA